MALVGLSETHFGRYLATGVIEAYKLPSFSVSSDRGEWLILKSSCLAYLESRKEGRLKEYLDSTSAYVKVRRRLTRQIRTLRQAGRVAKRDPLTDPGSRYHPGCFTVKQVASHAGVSTQVVYEHIKTGRIRAVSVVKGGRPRYGIERGEAKRYVAWAKGQDFKTHGQRQINQAGMLSVKDLVDRWEISASTVCRYIKHGRLKARRFGRYWAFDPEDVRKFENIDKERQT